MKSGTIITVLDIGSTKVCCCITSVAADGRFTILGTGYCACFGVKTGVINDMRSVERSISKALEIAETAADFRVKSVYVSISGRNIRSRIVSSTLQKKEKKAISNEDILQLMPFNESNDEDYDIIHAIPIMFTVDDQIGVKNPIGMVASKLQMSSNVVSASKNQIGNILECLDRCHLELSGFVLSCYASGLCVCDEEHPNSIVVDFGAGTTSVAFFYDGIFCGAEIIPIGGNNITNDIAFCLNISKASAERIKTLHGAAFVSIDDAKDNIYIPVLEGTDTIDLQQISKSTLNAIIQPRVEEILNAVHEKIDKSIFKKDFVNSYVIITGGGSQLTGLKDFASNILGKNVIVKQTNSHGIDSSIQVDNDFSVTFGMIEFTQMALKEKYQQKKANRKTRGNFIKKMKNWLKSNW